MLRSCHAAFLLLFAVDTRNRAVCAAANYFILGRTVYYLPWASPVDPRRATQIFIFLDWLTAIFVTPGLVKAYDDDAEDRRVGRILVLISLVMQALLYAGYIVILAIWHRRVSNMQAQKALPRKYLTALYACAVLIIIRCIYRCVEYSEGNYGELARHEAYFYVLDALPILAMVLLLNIYHPGKFCPRDSAVYVRTDGVTEVVGPGWSDERRWYWAVLDPLGLADYFRANKKAARFWEDDVEECRIIQTRDSEGRM